MDTETTNALPIQWKQWSGHLTSYISATWRALKKKALNHIYLRHCHEDKISNWVILNMFNFLRLCQGDTTDFNATIPPLCALSSAATPTISLDTNLSTTHGLRVSQVPTFYQATPRPSKPLHVDGSNSIQIWKNPNVHSLPKRKCGSHSSTRRRRLQFCKFYPLKLRHIYKSASSGVFLSESLLQHPFKQVVACFFRSCLIQRELWNSWS